MKRLILVLAALLGFASTAVAQQVVVPAEERYSRYSGLLPPCDDGGVTSRVSSRFAQKESEYWNSDLQIVGFDRFKEIGFRANGVGYIPRRYCLARATMSDNKERTVVYQIQEDLGIIGWGVGVEWCVIGLDRNFAYSPACSVLRPFAESQVGEKALSVGY